MRLSILALLLSLSSHSCRSTASAESTLAFAAIAPARRAWGITAASSKATTTTALNVAMTPDFMTPDFFMFNHNTNNNNKPRTNFRQSLTAAFSGVSAVEQPPLNPSAMMEKNGASSQPPPHHSNNNSNSNNMPIKGPDGIYHIQNQEQHAALFHSPEAADQIVVLKCYAPWCRACKGLEPKFLQLSQDEKYQDLPLQWADLSIQDNKAFVKSLGVLALPTIQFYVAGQLVDTFPCGPSKVPILKKKLAALVNQHVDETTRQIKTEYVAAAAAASASAQEQQQQQQPQTVASTAVVSTTTPQMTPEQRAQFLKIPYFADLDLADVDWLLDTKIKTVTFAPGSVIMREGEPGRTFYVVQDGEVEVCQSTHSAADPLVSRPDSYLGTVINRLEPGDYFGERALITGEPRAASIRAALESAVTCWMLDKADFPASSVLSGQSRGMATDAMVSDSDAKYGVGLLEWQESSQNNLLNVMARASQVRGSPNSPYAIRGVDTEDDVTEDEMAAAVPAAQQWEGIAINKQSNNAILSLLSRFNLIRHVSRCFDYIVETRASWGDEGIRKRRLMLVSRLTPAQRAEFVEAFKLIDRSGDGYIELIELKRVMESIGETKSDDELLEMISKGRSRLDGRSVISQDDFLGIMAEAEFYHLFRDIFASLDKEDSGYVRASDLDRVLSGVRDLISDDRKSIIDVEDKDMLVDYEQFSRMLLGTALI